MTPAEYAAVQLPVTPVILGATLQPFCLWHALMLERVGSVFSYELVRVPHAEPELGDLVAALEICRRRPGELPGRKDLDRLAARHRKLSEDALQAACMALEIHILEAFQAPKTWRETEGDDHDSGVPLLPAIKLGLMSRLHLSEEAALRTPIRTALHDLASLSALEGTVELVSGQDEKMMELAQAQGSKAERRETKAGSSTLNPQPSTGHG